MLNFKSSQMKLLSSTLKYKDELNDEVMRQLIKSFFGFDLARPLTLNWELRTLQPGQNVQES